MKHFALIFTAAILAFLPTANAEVLKKGERIIFLGDSITQGGAQGNGYIRQIESIINRTHPDYDVTIIGAGISGNKVPDCQKRLERDVLNKKPTLVFIYIGINDVWHWNKDRGTKKEDFDSGLRDIISKINAAGARVILCTPTVIGEKIDGSNEFDKMLDEYADISRSVAVDTGSETLDLRKGFIDHLKAVNQANQERGVLTRDTVHLNDSGNAKVAALMLATLGIEMPTLTMPSVFTSHMVLQRNKPVNVWGRAKAGGTVSVQLGDESATATATDSGNWQVTLSERSASSTPITMSVSSDNEKLEISDILVGDVWVGSGQSNMEWPLARTQGSAEFIATADHPLLRLYHVPKMQAKATAIDINASWKTCIPENVPQFSAVLYHFGKRLHQDISVPIGLINSSWGGSPIEPWTTTEKTSGGMYNAMIAPLANFPITGCIWYQGETNAIKKNGLTYGGKMTDLIEGWRKHWGADMPFYFVQIAPWSGAQYEAEQLPALWEAQTATLKLPNTGMAVVTDLVDNIADIHPQNKHDVGDRLALWALAKKYGKDLPYSGPLLKNVAIEGNTARVTFAHAHGLKSRDGKPLNEFKVAGADGTFIDAVAKIDGETVIVTAEGVTPVTVQFGWHKLTAPNLTNGAGLPAAPFQSNQWTGGTGESN